MCQATVYYEEEGEKQGVFREVVYMERTDQGWIIHSLFEDPKRITGRIENVDFLKHAVTLSREDS